DYLSRFFASRHQISVAWNYQLHQSLFSVERASAASGASAERTDPEAKDAVLVKASSSGTVSWLPLARLGN
ncbi:unnamed protein product, partial [Symbiodinium sp. KB8]